MAKAMPAMPRKGANLGVNSTEDMAASPVRKEENVVRFSAMSWVFAQLLKAGVNDDLSRSVGTGRAPQRDYGWASHVTPAKRLWSLLPLHTRRRQVGLRVRTGGRDECILPIDSPQAYSWYPTRRSSLFLHSYPPPTASTDPLSRDLWLARAESISVHTSLPPHPFPSTTPRPLPFAGLPIPSRRRRPLSHPTAVTALLEPLGPSSAAPSDLRATVFETTLRGAAHTV